MSKVPWIPWHKAVQLRDDIRTGELSMAIFAADLYDVVMQRAKSVYQHPDQFFSLTYPTFNLRELVKDVCIRLAGKNEKAVRQLALTYGGGKTHTLITLYHLVSKSGGIAGSTRSEGIRRSHWNEADTSARRRITLRQT